MKIALLATTMMVALISCTSNIRKMDASSMEPTIFKGEKISIIQTESLKRQDIIAFNHNDPTSGKMTWVFRVIGVPGDRIEIKQGAVYINGNLSKEPYTKLSGNITESGVFQPEILGSSKENGWNVDNYGPITIPLKGEMVKSKSIGSDKFYTAAIDMNGKIEHDLYFVLGDSRHDAYDSRFIGLIPKSEIVGVVKEN